MEDAWRENGLAVEEFSLEEMFTADEDLPPRDDWNRQHLFKLKCSTES